VVDVVADHLLEVEHARLVVHEGQHDHAERGLHGRMLVERVQDRHCRFVLLQLQDDAHAFSVRLVA